MTDADSGSFNDRMEKVADIIDSDPKLKEDTGEQATEQPDASAGPSEGNATGDAQNKTKEAGTPEPQATGAIEPPQSWPSDDKEAFKSLPSWAQERIVTRENEREAQFAERTRTIADRERRLNEDSGRTAQAQQKYTAELQKLSDIASQLLPAKFADIKSEADYLRLKTQDPQRAAEFEVFTNLLTRSQAELQQQTAQRLQSHLDNEWRTLQEKAPEYKDPIKGPKLVDDARKALTDFYGYKPEEVKVIQDHRQMFVIADAMKWRAYQATLKAAEGKKVGKQPTPALRQNGQVSGQSIGADEKTAILKRAAGTSDIRKKADVLAALIQ